MDRCERREELVAFLDNELSPTQRSSVAAHLEECTLCREELLILGNVVEKLVHLEATEPSPDLARRFKQRFQTEQRPGFLQALSDFLTLPKTRVLVGASCLALLTGLATVFLRAEKPLENPDEVMIAQNLELLSDYEAIESLEILENLDVISAMEDEK
jgi:anti-sigma factor RsiW